MNKNEISRIHSHHDMTWIQSCGLQTVQTFQDPYPEVGADLPRTCAYRCAPLLLALEDNIPTTGSASIAYTS